MPVRLLAATFEVSDPVRVARFWAGLLRRDLTEMPGAVLLCGDAAQVGLAFAPNRSEKSGPNRVHVHLTSTSQADQERTTAMALQLGARHLDVGQLPDEGHVVLADPGDNEFCVIEPGNSFLAGCGYLGELACDGSRHAGLFWSRALGWPLVWNHDQETAIQSEAGGTKVAWGGPAGRGIGPDRQRFDLVVDETDHDAEVQRLVDLGARLLDEDDGGITAMADPDGYEFRLRGGSS